MHYDYRKPPPLAVTFTLKVSLRFSNTVKVKNVQQSCLMCFHQKILGKT
jgi:hypothetical protein